MTNAASAERFFVYGHFALYESWPIFLKNFLNSLLQSGV